MAIGLYFITFAASLALCAEARVYTHDCDVDLTIGDACTGVINFGVNDTQIDEILNAHKSNKIESLTWSSDLAELAQAWANQCINNFDRCVAYANSPVKQVIDVTTDCDSVFSLTDIINGIYKQKSFLSRQFRPTHRFPPRPRRSLTGDYTDKIGCGLVTSQEGQCLSKRLVCNYGPRENSNAQPTN